MCVEKSAKFNWFFVCSFTEVVLCFPNSNQEVPRYKMMAAGSITCLNLMNYYGVA